MIRFEHYLLRLVLFGYIGKYIGKLTVHSFMFGLFQISCA